MKKKISLALALVMCLALLAGCGSTSTGSTTDTGSSVKLKLLDSAYAEEQYGICVAKENTELLDNINTALAELQADGTVQAIIDKYISDVPNDLAFQTDVAADAPELVMATNAAFPPYEFYDGDTVMGIDAEIARAIADKLGMKLVIEDTEFGSIIAGVQTGKYDIGMGAITITDERKESVNFSDSYATGIQSVIVPEDSPITSVDDLFADGATYMVGVQQDTTGDIYATSDFGEDRVTRYNKGADAVQALVSGKVDCVIIDNAPAQSFVDSINSGNT